MSREFKDAYVDLLPRTAGPILEQLADEASHAVFGDISYGDQARTYTAAGHRAVYESHQRFFERMGLEGETYLCQYLKNSRKVDNAAVVGPSAIVGTYAFSDIVKE